MKLHKHKNDFNLFAHDKWIVLHGEQNILDILEDLGPDSFILSNPFPAPDVENVMGKAAPKTDSSPQTQEASVAEPEGATLGGITNHKRTVQK